MDSQESQTNTILVVEDHNMTALATTTILQDAGFSVTHAADGEEALYILNKGFNPQLILLDVFMPVMNGYELLEKLKIEKKWAKIPVVMLSVLSDSDDVQKAINFGAVDYCVKPLDASDISRTIKRYVK